MTNKEMLRYIWTELKKAKKYTRNKNTTRMIVAQGQIGRLIKKIEDNLGGADQ